METFFEEEFWLLLEHYCGDFEDLYINEVPSDEFNKPKRKLIFTLQ